VGFAASCPFTKFVVTGTYARTAEPAACSDLDCYTPTHPPKGSRRFASTHQRKPKSRMAVCRLLGGTVPTFQSQQWATFPRTLKIAGPTSGDVGGRDVRFAASDLFARFVATGTDACNASAAACCRPWVLVAHTSFCTGSYLRKPISWMAFSRQF
jgi:hypothetical protein